MDPLLRETIERLSLQTTTLWDFPYQSPPGESFGDQSFRGVTPAGLVWNLVLRFTQKGDWIVDPMAGSGTSVDVARRLGRRAVGFDLAPRRLDIHLANAHEMPLPDEFAQLVFLDPPYGDNLQYSDDPRCLGAIPSDNSRFYEELGLIAVEVDRVLRPGGYTAWLISDQYRRSRFTPVAFTLFAILGRLFRPVDVVAVARRNDHSLNPSWEHWSRRANFLLRGFKYLLIFQKEGVSGSP